MKKNWKNLLEPSGAIYFALDCVFAVVSLILKNFLLAGCSLAIAIIIYIVSRAEQQRRHVEIKKYISSISEIGEGGTNADCPLPMALIRLGDGTIMWTNGLFDQLTGYVDKMYSQRIDQLVSGFHDNWLAAGKKEYTYDVAIHNHRYRIFGSTFRSKEADDIAFGMLYFTDLTELYHVRDEYIRSRPVVAIIYVDNYEELIKNMPETAISAMNAQIDEVVTKWASGFCGLLRHMERNRYLLVFERRYLKLAIENRFSILEEIHRVTNPSGLQASVSIGVGVDSETYEEGFDFAALSVEMALSRGGEQAVIKNRYEFSFYGEGGRKTERRNKVRSRVMANSLMELIGQNDQVFIMGHKNADLDALGAAMGICCICRKMNKKAYIVLDLERNSLGRFMEEVQKVPEYQDVFITGQDALLMCNNRSVLVVVDTNRPDQVEFRPLLEAIAKVCVVDHHRRAADFIEEVVMNFHETSASSASELTTELLEYSVNTVDVLPIEAKALLAGIFLDTKSFQVRTGDRTFEAAAFLRRIGADTVEVKKLLQNDFQDTISKYQIIKSSRLYRQEIAIAALNSGTTRVLAAQAADELLNISGITASFVIYPQGEEVIVSARSIGEVNVQIVLEGLGGGGNAATAGAQIHGSSVKEVVDRIIEKLDITYEEIQNITNE